LTRTDKLHCKQPENITSPSLVMHCKQHESLTSLRS